MLKNFSRINHLQFSLLSFNRLYCSFNSTSNKSDEFVDRKFMPSFTLQHSLYYLSSSEKYKFKRTPAENSKILKYEHQILKIFKKNDIDSMRKYDEIKSTFKNNDLDLESRLALMDNIEKSKITRADIKFCFNFFFRNYFTLILNKEIVYKNQFNRFKFLRQINPKIYIKILLHYSYNYIKIDLLASEKNFLSSYLSTTISHEYDYDIYESITLLHSIFKLNIIADKKLIEKQIDCFLKASDKDRKMLFYPLVKVLRQQNYYDENILSIIKRMLFDHIDIWQTKIVISVLATFTNFAIIDEELFKLASNTLISRDDLRLNDIAKFLWCCSYSNYDLIENEKLFQFLLKKTRSELKKMDYVHRASDAIDIIKSLVMFNVYDNDLIDFCLRETKANDVLKNSQLLKPKYDLFFIIKSFEIENPDNIPIEINNIRSIAQMIPNSLQVELENRKDFNNFMQFLQNNLNFKFDYEFIYPLPHINSCSIKITYFKNKIKQTCIMELQDESNTFRNAPDKLKNIFATKLRQLNALNLNYLLFKRSGNTFVRI